MRRNSVGRSLRTTTTTSKAIHLLEEFSLWDWARKQRSSSRLLGGPPGPIGDLLPVHRHFPDRPRASPTHPARLCPFASIRLIASRCARWAARENSNRVTEIEPAAARMIRPGLLAGE